MKKALLKILFILILIDIALPETNSQLHQSDLRENKIRELIQERAERYHQEFGIVVGLINEEGRQIIKYGKQSLGSAAIPPIDKKRGVWIDRFKCLLKPIFQKYLADLTVF